MQNTPTQTAGPQATHNICRSGHPGKRAHRVGDKLHMQPQPTHGKQSESTENSENTENTENTKGTIKNERRPG